MGGGSGGGCGALRPGRLSSRDGDVTRGDLSGALRVLAVPAGAPEQREDAKAPVRTSSPATVIPEGQAGAVQRSVTTDPTRFPVPQVKAGAPRGQVSAPHTTSSARRCGLGLPGLAEPRPVPAQHFVPPCDSHFRPRPALCPWHLPGRSEGRPALCSLQAPPPPPHRAWAPSEHSGHYRMSVSLQTVLLF